MRCDSDVHLYADSTLSVVKGSGSLTAKAFMTDYTKNLTQQVASVYGSVQYTYDGIGDTQGRRLYRVLVPCCLEGLQSLTDHQSPC